MSARLLMMDRRRRAGAVGGAFSPSALAPLAWYDPSDLSTLKQNSDGTGAVTADGDSVGYMADKSGNGYHMLQATSGKRPLYKTSGGLSWLEFDGSDDSMTAANVPLSGATAYGAMCLQASDFTVDYARSLAFASSGHQDYDTLESGMFITRFGVFTANFGSFQNFAELSHSTLSNATSYVVEAMWNGTQNIFSVNGTDATAAASVPTFATGTLWIGNSPDNSKSAMRMYGCFIKATTPSRAALRTWLGAKGGIIV